MRAVHALLVTLIGVACAGPPDLSGRHTLPELEPGDSDPALGYEEPPRFLARELLPEALRVGKHHHVTDPVTSDGFLHVFVVASDYGRFEVAGDALLRQRLGEISALGALHEAERDTAFAPALERAGRLPFVARWDLARAPWPTARGMPEEAWQELLAIDASDPAARSAEGERALKSYLRFERARRRLASHLDVDEHAQNPALQRELNRVALAMFAGGFPLSNVPPSDGAAAPSHHPFAARDARLASLLSSDTPEDLRRVGRIELAVLGVPPETRERALTHAWLTPRHLTILVASLVAMEGAANRSALVEAAVNARSETDALVYQRIAEMLRAVHENVSPVVRLDTGGRFVRATLADGRVILPVEVDRVVWTRALERLVEGAPGVEGAPPELWLSGSASPRARTELAARGFAVVERAFERFERLETRRAAP